jgi:hypothetical protein
MMNMHILFSVTFLFFENGAVYEIMWKNKVEPDSPQMTLWSMRMSRWLPTAQIHSDYVILIAFLLQQWLHERATPLRCTYTACLDLNCVHHFLALLYSLFGQRLTQL